MGCDIHLAVEVRKDGTWKRAFPQPEDVDPWLAEKAAKANAEGESGDEYYKRAAEVTWFRSRNYDAFAILADVRNGRGFAGIPTGEGFVPIAEPRGLPGDLSVEVARLDFEHREVTDVNLGDHSKSWLTLAELCDYDWSRTTRKYGVISLAEFESRLASKTTKGPNRYSGDVYGPNIVVLSRAEAVRQLASGELQRDAANWQVREEWETTYAEAADTFHDRVLPALRRLAEREGVCGGDVRIVFGFNS